MKDLLLITPPFTQLNTPYPGTAYLKGFLNTKNISAFQIDLGIEVILNLFSKTTFENLFRLAETSTTTKSDNSKRIIALKHEYLLVLDDVIAFLQNKKPTLARQLATDNFLPQASRFNQLDDMDWAFGNMGLQDKAKHFSTLFLEDLSDFIVECIDPHFGFSRYAERLGQSANSFDDLHNELDRDITFIDDLTLTLLEIKLKEQQPKLVCFSVPFPGNLYSAFRCAQYIKIHYPNIKIALGGGYPNTELREINDKRVFSFFDFISLDDGELPIELIYNHVSSPKNNTEFKRTFLLENGTVVYKNNSTKSDYKQSQVGTPDYSDLKLQQYISVIEIANPMHSLWSDGRWNKLTMAHGCYWGKCTFCDISLDYIKIYEPLTAKLLVDRMEELMTQTNETGFHFVDEAAPPALMKALALEILKRHLVVTWWTNIRFEKNFTKDLCLLLKASGCIAVSGGLEVASDRLLKLIDKGVTVEQVAKVTRYFTEANIMVHSYLMYGYPTQTIQETIDSLEMVRQLFELGIIQSGFWHQFALTTHSPIGQNPERYNITPHYNTISFANNDVNFTDQTTIDHNQFSFGLKKSLFNYMHGIGFDIDLQDWFDFKIPYTTIDPYYIEECLTEELQFKIKSNAKIVWLGSYPITEKSSKTKKGHTYRFLKLKFHTKSEVLKITLNDDYGHWFLTQLETSLAHKQAVSFSLLKKNFEKQYENFELFWFSKPMLELTNFGLITI